MRFAPTEEQLAVIGKTRENFSVLASAGSGKTFVLSERYVKLVQDEGYRPSEMLTITFTKRAAAEMKKRIVARLRAVGLFEQAQEAETGPIQTIHSFCERLLRENSVEARIDPDFTILGEGESSALRRQAIEQAMLVDPELAPDADYAMGQLAGQRGHNDLSVHDRIRATLFELLVTMRESGIPRQKFEELYAFPQNLLSTQREVLERHLPEAVLEYVRANPQQDWAGAVSSGYKAIKLKGKPAWIKNVTDSAEVRSARITCGMVQIACEAWKRLDTELWRRQAFDFSNLEQLAVQLLEHRPAMRARMAKLYRIVMVDEAQDVNPMQYRLLNGFTPESLMMVGDDQQSIFGFRNADVELFRQRSKQGAVRLSKNHRSSAGILRFVDEVFGPAWAENYRPMSLSEPDPSMEPPPFEDVERWQLGAADDWNGLARLVRQANESGVAYREMAVLVRGGKAAAGVADALRSIGIGVQLVSGPEKFFSRLEVHDLANTLDALLDESDHYAHLAMLRSPVVGLSMDAIVLLSKQVQPGEETVRSLVRSFVSPVADDQEKLDHFRSWFYPLAQIAERLPGYEVLAEVLAKSSLMTSLAKREDFEPKIANIRKLLSIAAASPDQTATEFATAIRQIQELRHKEGEAPYEALEDDLVTVSTVHKAKGLEWPMVILADAMQYKVRAFTGIAFDSETGILSVPTPGGHATFYEYQKLRHKAKEEAEMARLMYVAMTRPRQKLSIVSFGDGGKGMLKLMRESLGKARFDQIPVIQDSLGESE